MLGVIAPLYALSGFAVGLLVGLTGVGGGSLMTPLLVLLFGITPMTAVGTDLLYAAATKSVGTVVHGLGGTVEWRVVALLTAGSMPAAVITLIGLVYLGVPAGAISRVISPMLGVALLLTACSLVFRPRIVAWAARQTHRPSLRGRDALTVAVGVVLGVLVSLSSVGAGAIGVTALILLYPSLPVARVIGSDIAHAVPLTLVAGVGHFLIGSLDLKLLCSLLVGSIPGIVVGSLLTGRMPERVLRPILATVLLLVGCQLL